MNDYQDTLDDALELWGEELQMDVAVEEFGELVTEIARIQRGTRSHANENLVDEIADAQIILDQLKAIAGPDDVEDRIEMKADRLQGRIKDEYEEREPASAK